MSHACCSWTAYLIAMQPPRRPIQRRVRRIDLDPPPPIHTPAPARSRPRAPTRQLHTDPTHHHTHAYTHHHETEQTLKYTTDTALSASTHRRQLPKTTTFDMYISRFCAMKMHVCGHCGDAGWCVTELPAPMMITSYTQGAAADAGSDDITTLHYNNRVSTNTARCVYSSSITYCKLQT